MTLVLIGLLFFLVGAQPDLIGMNRSQTVGFVQIGVWLFGLALILVGAYATVRVVRNGKPTSLLADVGLRLIATGYVVAVTASLADFIGVGAQRMPNIHFGPVQMIGLITGVVLSLLGVILYWPRSSKKAHAEPPDAGSESSTPSPSAPQDHSVAST